MKEASSNYQALNLPKEAYNKKGYYDSDGKEGNESWQDDVIDSLYDPDDGVIPEEIFAEHPLDGESFTEGPSNINGIERSREYINRVKRNIGKAAIGSIILDRTAA